MTCRDYIDHHTALLDGDLPDGRASALVCHAEGCPSCADYDRSVRRSLELLREVETIDVSDDFALRLQHRLLHVREEEAGALRRSSPAMASAVAVAAFLALAAWSPWLMEQLSAPRSGAPVAGSLQATSPRTLPALPADHAAPADPWHGFTPAGLFAGAPGEALPLSPYALPGPSSPVVVLPPPGGRPAVRAASWSVENE